MVPIFDALVDKIAMDAKLLRLTNTLRYDIVLC